MKAKSLIILQLIAVLLLLPLSSAFADEAARGFTVSMGETEISIGDSASEVTDQLGSPKRIDPSPFGFDWHVYSSDYTRFIMVGISNGTVKGIYTNSRYFKTDIASYGDVNRKSTNPYIRIYTDVNNGNRVHAILVTISEEKKPSTYTEAFIRAQELEAYDLTNAFRANNGLTALKYNYIAASAAKAHSSDMAKKSYFSHIGLNGSTPADRYLKASGKSKNYGSFSGENLSGGRMIAIESFNDWVNSKRHRDNMLGKHTTVGSGYVQNSSSQYKFYITQVFTR